MDKHRYEYSVNDKALDAPSKVVRMVGKNKRVLELGPGPGSISKILKQNNCQITAIEIDPTAIDKLQNYCNQVYQSDLNSEEWVSNLDKSELFDVLVAADVFEHLYWPERCLKLLKPFFSEDGYLVVSLPHVGHNGIIASLLDADFRYRDTGLLDRTHMRFFGLKNMQELFESSGYKILEAEFVLFHSEQIDLAEHWNKLNQKFKALLTDNHYGDIFQVVMKIVPKESKGNAIQLLDVLARPDNANPYQTLAEQETRMDYLDKSLSEKNKELEQKNLQISNLLRIIDGIERRFPYRVLAKYRKKHLKKKSIAICKKSMLFDKAWYLNRYKDVKAVNIDPVVHYVKNGAAEGRDPGPHFSTMAYLEANPHVKKIGINPLVYFEKVDKMSKGIHFIG